MFSFQSFIPHTFIFYKFSCIVYMYLTNSQLCSVIVFCKENFLLETLHRLLFAGIRSASFQTDTLTIGTGLGMIMFYDLRANKYLESSINSTRTVVLKASRGYVVSSMTLSSLHLFDCHIIQYVQKVKTRL